MTVEAALSRARQTHERLTELVNGQSLPADHRGRLAGGCFWITLDLHAAITLLIERDMPASAFVLSRPIWEALIRGLWLAECADDQALERFLNDQDSLKPWPMIQDLERKEAFDEGVLSAVHAANKDRLHSMTHIGGPLAARCNSADAIEGNFEASEIVECLNNATAIAVLAALGMAKLSDNGTIAAALLQLVRETSR